MLCYVTKMGQLNYLSTLKSVIIIVIILIIQLYNNNNNIGIHNRRVLIPKIMIICSVISSVVLMSLLCFIV